MGDSLISWKSKKQHVVSRSSATAEYRSIANASSDITFFQYLLQDFGIKCEAVAQLFCDNVSAIHIANNPVFHERTKHIEIDCHFVRDKIDDGSLQLSFVGTKQQPADLLTKAISESDMTHFLFKLGVSDPYSPEGEC